MSITEKSELFTRIPVELWIRVLEYGTAQELVSLKQSCRALRDILPVEEILLEQQEFGILVRHYPDSDILRGHMERGGSEDVIGPLLKGFEEYDYYNDDELEQFVIDFLELHAGNGPFDASSMDNALMHQAASTLCLDAARLVMRDPRVSLIDFGPGACNLLIEEYYRNGITDTLKFFLDDPRVNPSAHDDGMLHGALDIEDLNLVRFLVQDLRVDPSICDNEALYLAVKELDFPLVCHLMADERVDPSARGSEALINAAESGCLAMVDLLLRDSRVDPSVNDNEALQTACNNGFINIVERLLQDSRVDPSDNFNKPLRNACKHGFLNIVERLLIDPRVDPAACDNEAFTSACTYGHLRIVKRLMKDKRVDPSLNSSNEAAINAYIKGDHELLRILQRDPRVARNWVDKAIVESAKLGYTDKVVELLRHTKADQSSHASRALSVASCVGHLDIVELLLQDPRVDRNQCDVDMVKHVKQMKNRRLLKVPEYLIGKRPLET